MSITIVSLVITADHPVPVEPGGGSAVVKVVTGGTVYYGSTRNVSSTSNDGSITVGNSQTFTTPAYLISTARADCTVTITDTITGQLTLDSSGNPTATTQAATDSSTRLATTAFVANATQTIRSSTQAGNYTFALADAGTVVEGTKATAQTFTVDTNANVPFPVGTVLEVHQHGAGQITIAAAGGVTLHSDGGKVATAAQYATIGLRQRVADEWILSGDLA